MAGLAFDVVAAGVGQLGQGGAVVLVLHLHVDQALVAGAGGQGENGGQQQQGGGEAAFHGKSPWKANSSNAPAGGAGLTGKLGRSASPLPA